MTDKVLLEKFGYSISNVEAPKRIMQTDSASCGVYTCMYAKLLASDCSLNPPRAEMGDFRKEIYNIIAGNCLSYSQRQEKEKCAFCDDQELHSL